MAGYNELQVGRYSRLAGKFFSMKGPGILNTLVPELQLAINLFYGPENRYLEGWDRFIGGTAVAAAAGFVSGIRFRNPAGSNVVMMFEKLAASIGTAGQLNFTIAAQASDLASVSAIGTRLDARGRSNTALSISSQNTTASIAGANVFPVVIPAATTYDYIWYENQELPVLPGDAITLIVNSVNVLLTVAAIWRERQLEESERA